LCGLRSGSGRLSGIRILYFSCIPYVVLERPKTQYLSSKKKKMVGDKRLELLTSSV
jgi:hypothetical protein